MKRSILLAACAKEILHSIPITLTAAGHRVQIAESGLDALRKARRRPPDLIILDDALQDMDGTTVREILNRLPSTASIPTILLAPRPPEFSAAPPLGDTAPPFHLEELLRRIREILCRDAAPPPDLCDEDAA